MFDEENENKDGLNDNASQEADNNSSEGNEEIISGVENVTSENGEGNSSTTISEEKDSIKTEDKTQADEGNSISADLIRGHINTIILRALYERDKYGYENLYEKQIGQNHIFTLMNKYKKQFDIGTACLSPKDKYDCDFGRFLAFARMIDVINDGYTYSSCVAFLREAMPEFFD